MSTKISYSSTLVDPLLTLKAIATCVHKSICPEAAQNGYGMGAAASRHNTLHCRRENGESGKGELLSQRAFSTAEKLAGATAPGPGPGGGRVSDNQKRRPQHSSAPTGSLPVSAVSRHHRAHTGPPDNRHSGDKQFRTPHEPLTGAQDSLVEKRGIQNGVPARLGLESRQTGSPHGHTLS